ncbi:hypothetical protein [Methanobacterium sp.]|uniref:hypothetical protein n=1 Tax=Methanobacterium sp. TaxID=2164 RepID=UPI00315832B0
MSELDLDLKLQIMRFLWYNGHYVRKNVVLPRYSYGKITSDNYTDIDVLGLKMDEHFKQIKVICDCKSGRGAKNTDRIFWLHGLMKYAEARNGIFLRTQINESKYFDLARKLDITPISLERLEELENSYKIGSLPYIGPFDKNIIKREEEIFKKLKSSSKTSYYYLVSGYWNDIPQKQIKLLINVQSRINSTTNMEEEEKMFLQVYTLSLLSLSILKFSEPILIFPDTKKSVHIKESLLGEGIEIEERKKVLESVYTFLSNELKIKTGEKFAIPKEDFMGQLYPKYSKYLFDLIQRVCLNPIDAIQIPRFLDIIAYEFILKNERTEVPKKLFSNNNNFELDMVSKLAKNFILFGNRANFIPNERYKILNHLLSQANK